MNIIINIINHPTEAFYSRRKLISWVFVILTVTMNSVFEPFLRYFKTSGKAELNIIRMAQITIYGVLAYIVFCIILWLVSKYFGSRRSLSDHIRAWGMTFFPNIICAITVAITEVYFYVFWNNMLLGMLLNFIFFGVLIWKGVLFLLYLHEFSEIKGKRLILAGMIYAVLILMLAAFEGYLGIQTPVI